MNCAEQNGFVDIHSHILPGLDDGPATFAQTLATAAACRAVGIDTVIATPHSIQGSRWNPTPDQVRQLACETEQQLESAGVALRILPGMEIAVSDLVRGRVKPDELLSLADTGIFLVEFPLNTPELPGSRILEQCLAAAGQRRIIIAHPERCAMFRRNPDLVGNLVAAGARLQVNIASLLGVYGKKEQATGLAFFEAGLVHFLATDTHGRSGRTAPTLKQMQQLNRLLGAETVTTAFHRNPRQLLTGKTAVRPPLPQRPLTQTNGLISRIRRLIVSH